MLQSTLKNYAGLILKPSQRPLKKIIVFQS